MSFSLIKSTPKIDSSWKKTQHLAVAAQAVYFGPRNEPIPAILTTNVQRLILEWVFLCFICIDSQLHNFLHRSIPAHILSVLLIVIGIAGFGLHLLHAKSRDKLWLTSPPGSIPPTMSLTSRSGFGTLLLPYDDEQLMEDKLEGLMFHLDPRTGAIVAEDGLGKEVTLLGEGAHRSAGWSDIATPPSMSSFKETKETP